MCPNRPLTETLDDVEFGLDNAQLNFGASPPTGTLLMADLKVGRNEVFKAASLDGVMSLVMQGSTDGTKGCSIGGWHGAGGSVLGKNTEDPGLQAEAKDVSLQLSYPISPFGKFRDLDLSKALIFTNDPDGPAGGINKQSLHWFARASKRTATRSQRPKSPKTFMKNNAPDLRWRR